MNPLVVASRLGKLVNLRLADGMPLAGEGFLVHPVFELHQVVKDFHVCAFSKHLIYQARCPAGVVVCRHQDFEHAQKFLPFCFWQRCQYSLLGAQHRGRHLLQELFAFRRDLQQTGASIFGRDLALYPTTRLQAVDHATDGGGVKANAGGQRALVNLSLIHI